MGFSHTGGAEHEERVVGLHLGVVGNGLAYGHRQFVAGAVAVVVEGVVQVELRVDVVILLVHKRVAGLGGLTFQLALEACAGTIVLERDGGLVVGRHHVELVLQLHLRPEDALQRGRQQIQVTLLELLDIELRRHAEREPAALEALGNDGSEPNRELLGWQIVLDDSKAIIPHFCYFIIGH